MNHCIVIGRGMLALVVLGAGGDRVEAQLPAEAPPAAEGGTMTAAEAKAQFDQRVCRVSGLASERSKSCGPTYQTAGASGRKDDQFPARRKAEDRQAAARRDGRRWPRAVIASLPRTIRRSKSC